VPLNAGMANNPKSKTRAEKWPVLALVTLLPALGLCAWQFGDRNNLNSMPFEQVEALVPDLSKAQTLAKQGNIELLAGQAVQGQTVNLRGEITDANCFLSAHTHAYDHAFCAKLCVAAGSPLVFVPDQGDQIYIVITPGNAVRVTNSILDQIGVPGITGHGKRINVNGVRAFAIESVGR